MGGSIKLDAELGRDFVLPFSIPVVSKILQCCNSKLAIVVYQRSLRQSTAHVLFVA